jgi:type I restriction enzyme S subunit
MRLRPYESYKPSGIDWLRDVPEHWEVKRLKYSASINDEALPETTDPTLEIVYVDIGSVDSIRGFVRRDPMVFEDSPSRARRIVRDGDTIVSTVRTYLRAIAPIRDPDPNTIVSTGFAVVRPRQVHPVFLSYALREQGLVDAIVARSVGVSYPAVNASEIGTLAVPLPSEDEQGAIADFLDRETAKIDTLVEKKRTLIERLKEKRTALISRTVTRGLPPDAAAEAGLDPSPRLKPSGIDWLGDVPEHWEVKAIKWESPVLRGASPRPIDDEIYFDDEGDYAWVRIADVSAAGMYLVETTQRLSPLGTSLSVPLEPGALFLSIAGSVGKPCITRIKCCIHDGFVYFPRWRGDVRFLYYVFASGEPYKGLGKLGTQLNLNTDTVGSIVSGFPPVSEQRIIADFLDCETARIDHMATKVEAAIERLQEYRTALITAGVTGKIDVRGAAT